MPAVRPPHPEGVPGDQVNCTLKAATSGAGAHASTAARQHISPCWRPTSCRKLSGKGPTAPAVEPLPAAPDQQGAAHQLGQGPQRGKAGGRHPGQGQGQQDAGHQQEGADVWGSWPSSDLVQLAAQQFFFDPRPVFLGGACAPAVSLASRGAVGLRPARRAAPAAQRPAALQPLLQRCGPGRSPAPAPLNLASCGRSAPPAWPGPGAGRRATGRFPRRRAVICRLFEGRAPCRSAVQSVWLQGPRPGRRRPRLRRLLGPTWCRRSPRRR